MAADSSGQSWAVLAMSEMGKGVWLKQRLAALKPSRLVIWDVLDEYDRLARQVGSFRDLVRAIAAPSYAVRYVPRSITDKALRAEFETFCLVAYAAKGATIVVEELADVTSAGYAPPAWSKLNTRGRHHQGLTIYFCSQSPAWIDKKALGNATHLHVGYLGEPAHRVAAAAHMGPTTPADIDALAQFEFIEYAKATKTRSTGRVSIGGAAPVARKPRARAPIAHGKPARSPSANRSRP